MTKNRVELDSTLTNPRVSLALSILRAFRTVPLPFGFDGEPYAGEVEPLYRTIGVIASDHLSVRHLMAQAVGGFVGIDRHVQHVAGMRHTGGGQVGAVVLVLDGADSRAEALPLFFLGRGLSSASSGRRSFVFAGGSRTFLFSGTLISGLVSSFGSLASFLAGCRLRLLFGVRRLLSGSRVERLILNLGLEASQIGVQATDVLVYQLVRLDRELDL